MRMLTLRTIKNRVGGTMEALSIIASFEVCLSGVLLSVRALFAPVETHLLSVVP